MRGGKNEKYRSKLCCFLAARIDCTKRNFHKRELHAPAAQAATRIMDLYMQLFLRNVIYRPVKTRRWHVPS